MSRTQYQVLASPVLEGGETLTFNIESRWHQPWSEPVRFNINRQLAVALIVSGLTAPILTQDQLTEKFESRWHQTWSEPVRVSINPRLAVALANSGLTAPVPPVEIYVQGLEPPWHFPWSEPKRFKSGLGTHLQQYDLAQANIHANYILLSMHVTESPPTDTALFGIGINTGVPKPYIAIAKADVSIDEIQFFGGGAVSTSEPDP